MSDIMSILQSSYASTPTALISPGDKFKAVDPTLYQGTWTGKDYQNEPFTISVRNVKGYTANVVYQSSTGLQTGRVFITTKDTFRIGNSQFTLTGQGTAEMDTIVTNATTGMQTEQRALATLKS
jgi:hypothetical protein